MNFRFPETVVNSSQNTCVVLTSSTGSTNPQGAPADALNNEIDFWSDPELQQAHGFVGGDLRDEVVDPAAASKASV